MKYFVTQGKPSTSHTTFIYTVSVTFIQYRKNRNTFIVFSFNLVSPCCQILTIFILGILPNLKKNKRENGPSQQLLRHVIDTTVNLISLFNPNSRKTKLLITGSGIWF